MKNLWNFKYTLYYYIRRPKSSSISCHTKSLKTKNNRIYLHNKKKMRTFALANQKWLVIIIKHRGVEQLVARQSHNLEVACSSPASATKKSQHIENSIAAIFFSCILHMLEFQAQICARLKIKSAQLVDIQLAALT